MTPSLPPSWTDARSFIYLVRLSLQLQIQPCYYWRLTLPTGIGYTYDEKLHIARRFLLPKQLSVNGLSPAQLELSDPALLHIVTHYTREAGVRSLERAIGSVVRFKAVEWAEYIDADASSHASPSTSPASTSSSADSNNSLTNTDSLQNALVKYRSTVEIDELENILGIARWDEETIGDREPRRGVVYGLVVTGMACPMPWR